MKVETGQRAFVLAGGGSLGAVQVGMLGALVEAGERADLVVGSSVGALNAAFYAFHPDSAGIRRLRSLWLDVSRGSVFPLSLWSAFGWAEPVIYHADELEALLGAASNGGVDANAQ